MAAKKARKPTTNLRKAKKLGEVKPLKRVSYYDDESPKE
jgi:hypothetical protein